MRLARVQRYHAGEEHGDAGEHAPPHRRHRVARVRARAAAARRLRVDFGEEALVDLRERARKRLGEAPASLAGQLCAGATGAS